MNLAEGLQRLRGSGPASSNGASDPAAHDSTAGAVPWLRTAIAIVAPALVLVIAGLVRGRRPADAGVAVKDAASKVARPRRKPKNLLRYYGIGLLINGLERDATRKALIATLKWAQKRA